MDDTLKLVLHGDIPLDLFASAVRQFDALLESLAEEIAGPGVVRWSVDRLSSGSAIIQVRAASEDLAAVENAVRAYNAIGEALHRGEPLPFSPSVQRWAHGLTGLLNGHITSLDFVVNEQQYSVSSPTSEARAEQAALWVTSWGVLHGEVGAIAKRPRLQFTLYDSVFDRAVACFLTHENEQLAREIWGRYVSVTGQVVRRVEDGRPIRVRNIVAVEHAPRISSEFRQARGAVRRNPGDELPETSIRRWRDAI